MGLINCNVHGSWFSVDVTDEEVRTLRKSTYESNKAFLLEIEEDAKDLPADMRSVLLQSVVRHYHYRIEEFAKKKILAERAR